jgi:serine O-acetyltransferase
MDNNSFQDTIEAVANDLADSGKYPKVFRHVLKQKYLPSPSELEKFINDVKSVIFPGFFGVNDQKADQLKHQMKAKLEQIDKILSEQALYGICFECGNDITCQHCQERAKRIAHGFVAKLGEIRRLISIDIEAAYDGDPAAKGYAEVIYCYPSVKALLHYRVAHELLTLGLPIIPRIISEMAHSETGIDIHPGATIGEGFFMDHGTGVVIGETCLIGKNVRLYQGVTLGAKSFPKDENGNPIKGIPRHPIVEDDVVIYAGATLLGRITIGAGSIIGGNAWITESLPPGSRVSQLPQ